MKKDTVISFIIPAYNEEHSIEDMVLKLVNLLKEWELKNYELIIVNNASTDATLDKVLTLQKVVERIILIDLSRNFGNQYSLLAGWHHASGDVGISLDADGQDPVEKISEFLEAWEQGHKVVIGKKLSRVDDHPLMSLFKNIGTSLLPMESGEADFCLLDRQAMDELKKIQEPNLFLREARKHLGFKTMYIPYEREKRSAGTSSFGFAKLVNLGLIGFINYGYFPYKLFSGLIGLIAILGFLKVIRGFVTDGSILLCFALTLSLLLFIIKYLSLIHQESKKRSPYYINKIYK